VQKWFPAWAIESHEIPRAAEPQLEGLTADYTDYTDKQPSKILASIKHTKGAVRPGAVDDMSRIEGKII
jgi:hypothetical protein